MGTFLSLTQADSDVFLAHRDVWQRGQHVFWDWFASGGSWSKLARNWDLLPSLNLSYLSMPWKKWPSYFNSSPISWRLVRLQLVQKTRGSSKNPPKPFDTTMISGEWKDGKKHGPGTWLGRGDAESWSGGVFSSLDPIYGGYPPSVINGLSRYHMVGKAW